jgi:hypothetical protein
MEEMKTDGVAQYGENELFHRCLMAIYAIMTTLLDQHIPHEEKKVL